MKHLYPTGQGFLNGWPTTELDVEDALADDLLAYQPPVYSLEPTGWPPAVLEAVTAAEADRTPLPSFDEAAAAGDAALAGHAAGGFVEGGPELTVMGEAGTEFITRIHTDSPAPAGDPQE